MRESVNSLRDNKYMHLKRTGKQAECKKDQCMDEGGMLRMCRRME